MRFHGVLTNNYLTTPGDRDAQILVWIGCKNRETGDPAPIGLWTGPQAKIFTIGGEDRTYYGGGAILDLPQITRPTGLDVRSHVLPLSRKHPAVTEMLEVRNPRHATLQMHRALFDPKTGALVTEPHLEFDGFFDVPEGTRKLQSEDTVACKFTTLLHQLTQTSPLNYSGATSQRVGDSLLKYAAISGRQSVHWGEKSLSGTGSGK